MAAVAAVAAVAPPAPAPASAEAVAPAPVLAEGQLGEGLLPVLQLRHLPKMLLLLLLPQVWLRVAPLAPRLRLLARRHPLPHRAARWKAPPQMVVSVPEHHHSQMVALARHQLR